MIVNRVWSMPNKWTFRIQPIKELIGRYVHDDGRRWIDPFAGDSAIAEFRNDIKADGHGSKRDAIEFLKYLTETDNGVLQTFRGHYEGALLDPPYSFRQLFKTYKSGGDKLKGKLVPMTEINNLIAPLIKPNGYCISFGWNSNGLGMKRGFEIVEILVIAHGGHHNDTIVTVEKKVRDFGRTDDSEGINFNEMFA